MKASFFEVEITLLLSFHSQNVMNALCQKKTYRVVFYGYCFTFLNVKTF